MLAGGASSASCDTAGRLRIGTADAELDTFLEEDMLEEIAESRTRGYGA